MTALTQHRIKALRMTEEEHDEATALATYLMGQATDAIEFKRQRDELLAALKEITDGCIARRPGHVNYGDNRTKDQIHAIASAAIKKATS